MRTTIAETGQGCRIEKHFPHVGQIAGHVIRDRAIQKSVEALRNVVVGDLLNGAVALRRDGHNAAFLRGLVIRVRAEGIHPVPTGDGAYPGRRQAVHRIFRQTRFQYAFTHCRIAHPRQTILG
jgi:hypothetical protein